jgi:HEAT repeat protein
MPHVFISYKHEDLDFAENVQSRLERAGIKTWMDHRIHTGDEWRNQIDQAIKEAFAMIVIMTPEAKASEYITYEWSFAVGAGVRMIPIKYKATPLHPRLGAFQYLDFTNSVRPWERLIAEIQEAQEAAKSLRLASGMAIKVSTLSYIEQAKAALNATDANVRKGAIETLAQANSVAAHEALLEALSHPVADVRQQAVAAMGGIVYPAAVPKLIELLRDPAQNVRQAAVNILGNIRDARVVPGLIAAFKQASAGEKMTILWALYATKDEAVVPVLLAQYQEKVTDEYTDKWLRHAIVSALGNFQCAIAIPTLKHAMRDSELCISAVRALFQLESEEAIDAISDALLAMDRHQCEVALNATDRTRKFIAHLDDIYQKHLPGHATIANREKLAKVRRRIIWMLGVLKSKEAIPTLITSMDDEDAVVQQETIIAFKEIQDERSLPALMTILRWRFESYDEKTLLYALQALYYVGNASIMPQLKAVLSEMLDKSIIELAIRVISIFGKFGDYETIEYLRNVKTSLKHKIVSEETWQELTNASDDAIYEIRARLY